MASEEAQPPSFRSLLSSPHLQPGGLAKELIPICGMNG